MVYGIYDRAGVDDTKRADAMALCEMFFNLGRSFGQGFLLVFLFRGVATEYILAVLGAFQLFSAYLYKRLILQ